MERTEVEKKTFDYFESGFHCAEAISKTIIEVHATEPSNEIPRVASGFGGGIGKTHEKICGAVTGGVIGLGYLFGRMNPGEDFQDARELSAEYKKKFMEKYGATNCGEILKKFGEQENFLKCKRLTAGASGILSDIIMERLEKKTEADSD